MADAVEGQGFTAAQLEDAILESEREEAAHVAARNGGQDALETTSEETPKGKTVEELQAELDALKAKLDEKPKADEKTDEEPEAVVEEIAGVKLTDEVRNQWAPFYEKVRAGEPIPEEAFALAKEQFGVTDRSAVENYMRGSIEKSAANAAEYSTSVKAAAGGPEQYTKITEWAGENLTAEEIEEYNTSVNSGNAALAKAATQALAFRFKAEGGQKPSLMGGRTAAATVDVFTSMDEMVKAINDGRYDTDPAYRKQIEAKIERSNQSVSVTRGSKAY
jgi:hypothetical protein